MDQKNLSAIKPEELYTLVKQFYSENPPEKQKRGRPSKYPEELILFLLILKVSQKLSYRKLRLIAKETFTDLPIPSLRASFYRLNNLPKARLHQFLNWLVNKGIKIDHEKQENSYK